VQQRPLPRTEAASNACLTLPMFSSASKEQIDYVCKTLLEILDQKSLSLCAPIAASDSVMSVEA
jgi:hypothetical protein